MNKTIGILAHVDAGKTTFSEQLLYHTHTIKQFGRVDHKNAFLDSHPIEKERGITIFADQGRFTYGDSTYYLIDTPGHIDFSPEMERAIQIMDYAIIIISAAEGIEGHTETVWQLLRKHQIPTFFFINKTDREGANPTIVLEDIHTNLSDDAWDITGFTDGEMTEDMIEFIAERNERLFEIYLDNGYDKDLWLEACKKMLKGNKLFPCAHGSALKDKGIKPFLEQLEKLTETEYDKQAPFAARVYKIRYADNKHRLTFIKVLSGTLCVRDTVCYKKGKSTITEKITQLSAYHGKSVKQTEKVQAGEIAAVSGLSMAQIGVQLVAALEDTVSTETVSDQFHHQENLSFEMMPVLKSKVLFDSGIHPQDMLACFRIFEAEEPSLQVIWDEDFQAIYIHIMGNIQLEIVEKVMKERFDYNVSFQSPEILYKETIETSVIGYGHFEPWKHYAEVHLKIEPAPRETGITFENECHADYLSAGNQNLVRQHLYERNHHGLLTGSALTDLKITLLKGLAHHQHTKGGDFREATFRALRQGLEQAKNVLLEPYYSFTIKVDLEHIGRVMADIQQANGTFSPPEIAGDKATLTGKVPVATFMDYQAIFIAFTHGKGVLHLRNGGYDHCHNSQEVIENIAYNKDADLAYSSSSIFAAKGGATITVPWNEAKEAMHG